MQVEARRADERNEAARERKEAAHTALTEALSVGASAGSRLPCEGTNSALWNRSVDNARAGLHNEQDAERLRARAELVAQEAVSQAQQKVEWAKHWLKYVRSSMQSTTELRSVGLNALSESKTVDYDLLCAMAVQVAAHDGVDFNTQTALIYQRNAHYDVEDGRWLYVAARRGLPQTVRALLAGGAEVDHKDANGNSALYIAAQYADRAAEIEVMRALLAGGADVNLKGALGQTALWTAAEAGRETAVQVLLEAGADVNLTDVDGWTALYAAALMSNEEYDVDVDTRVDIVGALLQAGADVNHTDSGGRTVLHTAVDLGVTGAFVALVMVEEEVAEALIAAGADVNLKDKAGHTPLAVARATKAEGADALVQLLEKAGAPE